jgi:hypothetical protein
LAFSIRGLLSDSKQILRNEKKKWSYNSKIKATSVTLTNTVFGNPRLVVCACNFEEGEQTKHMHHSPYVSIDKKLQDMPT